MADVEVRLASSMGDPEDELLSINSNEMAQNLGPNATEEQKARAKAWPFSRRSSSPAGRKSQGSRSAGSTPSVSSRGGAVNRRGSHQSNNSGNRRGSLEIDSPPSPKSPCSPKGRGGFDSNARRVARSEVLTLEDEATMIAGGGRAVSSTGGRRGSADTGRRGSADKRGSSGDRRGSSGERRGSSDRRLSADAGSRSGSGSRRKSDEPSSPKQQVLKKGKAEMPTDKKEAADMDEDSTTTPPSSEAVQQIAPPPVSEEDLLMYVSDGVDGGVQVAPTSDWRDRDTLSATGSPGRRHNCMADSAQI